MKISTLVVILVFIGMASNAMVVYAGENPPWIDLSEWQSLNASKKLQAREVELSSRINTYLGIRSYRLGSGAKGDFERSITRAVREIQSLPPREQRKSFEEAVTNFRLFIDVMIDESERIPGYQNSHFRTIGEDTFRAALRKLCPIWPFCK